MLYQILAVQNGTVRVACGRSNDPYLLQEINTGLSLGWFGDGIWVLLKNGKQIEPMEILERDDARRQAWFERKSITHKQIWINSGMCNLSQNRIQIWVKK